MLETSDFPVSHMEKAKISIMITLGIYAVIAFVMLLLGLVTVWYMMNTLLHVMKSRSRFLENRKKMSSALLGSSMDISSVVFDVNDMIMPSQHIGHTFVDRLIDDMHGAQFRPDDFSDSAVKQHNEFTYPNLDDAIVDFVRNQAQCKNTIRSVKDLAAQNDNYSLDDDADPKQLQDENMCG
jgi:hypothetical protein